MITRHDSASIFSTRSSSDVGWRGVAMKCWANAPESVLVCGTHSPERLETGCSSSAQSSSPLIHTQTRAVDRSKSPAKTAQGDRLLRVVGHVTSVWERHTQRRSRHEAATIAGEACATRWPVVENTRSRFECARADRATSSFHNGTADGYQG